MSLTGTNNVAIGDGAGSCLTASNCTLIGIDAGADITDRDGLVIIGDGVRDLNPSNDKDTLFIGDNVAIGTHLFGQPCNLRALVEKYVEALDLG